MNNGPHNPPLEPEVERLVHAYHDGELTDAQCREAERVLAQMPAAARELEQLRELSASLAPLRQALTLDAAVMQALHRKVEEHTAAPLARVTGWLTAAAAIVLLTCSIMLWERRPSIPPTGPDIAATQPPVEWAVLQSPEAIAADPNELQSDSQLAQWIVNELK